MNDSIGCNSSTCPTIGSQSATVCKGIVNGKCDFVISQKIQIDLPVEFGATVKVGDTYVDCDCSPCRDACPLEGQPCSLEAADEAR